ncbi:hypothetical protein KYC5002_25565 [Archangium violaceum]|uniref:hypothetical protein n=1 Tax=Archangium violaceum TaxID=83451 RepID=UPI002B2F98C8|nr:hypothetical protein KYC5002_25565 [Archangium gephyra]
MATGRSPRLFRCDWRGPLLGLLLTSLVAQAAPASEAEQWFALAHLTPAEFEQRVAQVGCGKVPWGANVMRDDPLGFSEIPRPAALACTREHEALTTCIQDAIRAVGPRPGSSHGLTIVPPGSDPFYGKGPPTEAYWCTLMNSRLEACEWRPCTGNPLTGEALSRLAVAAGVSLREVPVQPHLCARKIDFVGEGDPLPWSGHLYFPRD